MINIQVSGKYTQISQIFQSSFILFYKLSFSENEPNPL